MWILLISILVALVIAFIVSQNTTARKANEPVAGTAPPQDCCGAHEVCDKETLLANESGEIIYFDDEELDLFAGKAPNTYTAGETLQFREVLLSMPTDEISEWLKSLRLRNIKLPLDVREEALSILKKQRA